MGKIETYIGFAIKSGKLKKGMNVIENTRGIELLILCASASDNTKKQTKNLSVKLKKPLIISNKLLSEILGKENCKTAAVTDKNLAKAILENVGTDGIFVGE